MAVPAQIGLFELAIGAAGFAFTTTAVVPALEAQPFTVTTHEYVPANPAIADALVGSSKDDAKLLGPVQLYEAFAIVFENKLMVCPTHTGLLLESTGAAGMVLIVTVTDDVELTQPFELTVHV